MNIQGQFEDKEKKAKEPKVKALGKASRPLVENENELVSFGVDFKTYDAYKDVTFAIKPRKTVEKVKAEFLSMITRNANVDKGFIEKVKTMDASEFIEAHYFEVFYFSNLSFNTSSTEATYDYRKTGKYTVQTSTDSNGKVTSTVTPETERVYAGSITHTYSHNRKKAKYCASHIFPKDTYYKIFDAKQEDIFPQQENSSLFVFRPWQKKMLRHFKFDERSRVIAGSDNRPLDYIVKDYAKATLSDATAYITSLDINQILLFPVWNISVEYNGKTYTSLFSDESVKIPFTEDCCSLPLCVPSGAQKGFNALTNIMVAITIIDLIAQIAFLAIFPGWYKLAPVIAKIVDVWLVCLFPTPVNNNSKSKYLSAFTLGAEYEHRKTGTLLRFFATLAFVAIKIVAYILMGAFNGIVVT